MHRYGDGLFGEGLGDESLLLIPFDFEEVPQLDSVVLRAGSEDLLGD
jgi:hypothetical protein